MKIVRGANANVLCVLVGLIAASSALAQTVTDGDAIKLNGTTYRLWGIVAPEIRQVCADGWPAGQMSATYLKGLVDGRTVTCEPKSKSRDGSTIAVCKADGQDIGASMVGAGMAWADIQYSQDYVVQASQAMSNVVGVHGNDCAKALEWRMHHRGDR